MASKPKTLMEIFKEHGTFEDQNRRKKQGDGKMATLTKFKIGKRDTAFCEYCQKRVVVRFGNWRNTYVWIHDQCLTVNADEPIPNHFRTGWVSPEAKAFIEKSDSEQTRRTET